MAQAVLTRKGGSEYTTITFNNFSGLSKSNVDFGLDVARRFLAATTVGNYALFGGGFTNSNTDSSAVDAYNTSLQKFGLPAGIDLSLIHI